MRSFLPEDMDERGRLAIIAASTATLLISGAILIPKFGLQRASAPIGALIILVDLSVGEIFRYRARRNR